MDNTTMAGYKSVGYFTNWSIYARNFFPWNVPAQKLTHILYSFGDNRADGEVFLTDKWADLDIHWTDKGDSWNDTGNNMYGCLKQFNLLKKQNRNLKIMLSIGGWTYTQIQKHLDAPASTPEGRKKFADSCVTLVKDLGFDGIDLDWEYPSTPEQGHQLLLLLKEVRRALDAYADVLAHKCGEKPHFQLTIAAPAGASKYANYPLKEIASILDFINLMAYDYAGSWDTTSSHQANLYHASKGTPFNTKSVIAAYIAAGVPSHKIVLGQPLYGRAFQHTTGIGQPFTGIGEPNQAEHSWEGGVWDFKALPRAGAIERIDEEAGASYSFNAATGELISYDNVGMAVRKAQYIKQNRLGGAMWWELSGDRPQGAGSLVQTVVGELGKLEQVHNWLRYPDSQYKNLAAGFT